MSRFPHNLDEARAQFVDACRVQLRASELATAVRNTPAYVQIIDAALVDLAGLTFDTLCAPGSRDIIEMERETSDNRLDNSLPRELNARAQVKAAIAAVVQRALRAVLA